MSRECKNWLETYMIYTANQESPTIFHRWVGLTVLSAVLGRRICVDHGAYQVHPNLFTILVGPSAIVKKSTAIALGSRLLEATGLGVQVIPQSATPEAFVRDLSKYTQKAKEESMSLICAPELLVFLRIRRKSDESVMIPLLTDLWDGHRPWRATTIKRGSEEVLYGNVSFLGGSTREWLVKAIPSQTTAGGFTGRCMFIEAGSHSKRIAFPSLSKTVVLARESLVHDLQEIAKLKGTFSLTTDAKAWYEKWYTTDLVVQLKALSDDEVAGFYGRIHDHVMKLAMILSVSESDNLVIEKRHLVQALTYIKDMEPQQRAVTEGMMATPFSEDCARVVDFVRSCGGFATWTEILRHMSRSYDAKSLRDQVIKTLEEMGSLMYVAKSPTGLKRPPGYVLVTEGAAYSPRSVVLPAQDSPEGQCQNGSISQVSPTQPECGKVSGEVDVRSLSGQ